MGTIAEDLVEFEQLKNASDTAEAIARSAAGETLGKMKQIRERIMAGESTGDVSKDFVIATNLFPSSELEERFRSLQEQLISHSGEFILVIRKERTKVTFRCFPGEDRESDYANHEEWVLGVIENSDILFDPLMTGWYKIQTGKYVVIHQGVPVLIARNIDSHSRFNRPGENPSIGSPVEVFVIGNSQVEDFFAVRGQSVILLFWRMARLLNGDLSEFPRVLEVIENGKRSVIEKLKKSIDDRVFTSRTLSGDELMRLQNQFINLIKMAMEFGLGDTKLTDLTVAEFYQKFQLSTT